MTNAVCNWRVGVLANRVAAIDLTVVGRFGIINGHRIAVKRDDKELGGEDDTRHDRHQPDY